MTSEVQICNLGLSHIRAGTIGSLEEPGKPAEACKLWYEPSRDVALADFPWNFAGKTIALAQQVEEPDEWSFGYAYPADCLKIRYIVPDGKLRHETDRIPYDVIINDAGVLTIVTNQDEASLRYTFKQTNPNLFDAHFRIAFSWQIAVNVAVPIVGSAKGRLLRDDANVGYLNAIRAAYSANSGEQFPGKQRDAESIEAYGESSRPGSRPIA